MAVASRARVVVTCALVVLAGCGGGSGSSSPTDVADSTSLPTTTAPSTTTTSPPAITEAVVTTEGVDTVASTEPGALGLSPDGPWRLVDSAPGVEGVGLVYELMPKLWVFLPTEVDLERGYLWTFNEQDRPIIEAYLLANLTLYRSIGSIPAQLDDPDFSKYYTQDLLDRILPDYQSRSDQGTYTDLDLGVVLQPRVIEDDRTETYAIILDCSLDGAVRRNADGSYAAGATPGVIVTGYANAMVLQDGSWKIQGYNEDVGACAAG